MFWCWRKVFPRWRQITYLIAAIFSHRLILRTCIAGTLFRTKIHKVPNDNLPYQRKILTYMYLPFLEGIQGLRSVIKRHSRTSFSDYLWSVINKTDMNDGTIL